MSTEGETCGVCEFPLLDSGLVCKDCSSWFHYNCCKGTIYSLFLMNFGEFEVPLICLSCAEKQIEHFDDEIQAFRKKIKHESDWLSEMKSKKKVEDEKAARAEKAAAKEDEAGNDKAKLKTNKPGKSKPAKKSTPPVQSKSAEEPKPAEKPPAPAVPESKYRTRNCRFYMNGHCLNGDKCKYKHPDICPNFKARGVCRVKKCKLYHPTICENSWNAKPCNTKKCKNYHLKTVQRKGPPQSKGKRKTNPTVGNFTNSQAIGNRQTGNQVVRNHFLGEIRKTLNTLFQQIESVVLDN